LTKTPNLERFKYEIAQEFGLANRKKSVDKKIKNMKSVANTGETKMVKGSNKNVF